MPKVYIKTYGCQMNERDSEQVSQMFMERGYTMTRQEVEADVILINTCSVRDQAEQKAIGKMGLMNHRYRPRRASISAPPTKLFEHSRGYGAIVATRHHSCTKGTCFGGVSRSGCG